jgi:hypothetical protein
MTEISSREVNDLKALTISSCLVPVERERLKKEEEKERRKEWNQPIKYNTSYVSQLNRSAHMWWKK